MTGDSVEATLELWASSLREAKQRIRPLFQQRVRTMLGQMLGQAAKNLKYAMILELCDGLSLRHLTVNRLP